MRQLVGMVSLLAVLAGVAEGAEAAPQQTDSVSPGSLARIRERLETTPAPWFDDLRVQMPATFKTRVDQRVFVLSLEDELHKLFDLTPLQRRQRELAAKCCGLDLIALTKAIQGSLRRRAERRVREQVAQELAQLEAARRQDY